MNIISKPHIYSPLHIFPTIENISGTPFVGNDPNPELFFQVSLFMFRPFMFRFLCFGLSCSYEHFISSWSV